MHPLFHLGMRIGPEWRRRVAAVGWVAVALPSFVVFVVHSVAFSLMGPVRDESPMRAVKGTVESWKRDVRHDGNATHSVTYVAYRYDFRGQPFLGTETTTNYRYQNEGGRKYEAERTAWQPERNEILRPGDEVTVYVDEASPGRSSLHPPQARVRFLTLARAVSAALAGILLSWLAWIYYHEPVEILVAAPSRAEAIAGVALGVEPVPAGFPGEEVKVAPEVAVIGRGEGTTRIDFPGSAAPTFRLSGLFPPVLLLAILVAWADPPEFATMKPGNLAIYAAIALVLWFIARPMTYGRAGRSLWIRGGVMDVVRSGVFVRGRKRLARNQIDRIESRWALSELSRFGESAYFDLVAVLGNGRRVILAEGLPRVEVADTLARLVAREIGLAPEQARSAEEARRRDLAIAHDALARERPSTRDPA